MHDLQRRDRNAPIRSIMLDIWLVYWIPVSKGMEDAMSTPRIPPEDCPCGKAQTCYECTHPPSERDKVLDELVDTIKEDFTEGFDGDLTNTYGDFLFNVNSLRKAGSP